MLGAHQTSSRQVMDLSAASTANRSHSTTRSWCATFFHRSEWSSPSFEAVTRCGWTSRVASMGLTVCAKTGRLSGKR